MKHKGLLFFLGIILILAGVIFMRGSMHIPSVGETTESVEAYLRQIQSSTENAEHTTDSLTPQENTDSLDETDTQGTTDSLETAEGYYGALQVKNGTLCGADGNPVQLRGVSTHGLNYYPEFVTEESISYMRENWGINVFRLALYTTGTGGYCVNDDTGQQKLLDLIDTGVKAATANDMYVIIDWHILEDGNPNTYIGRATNFFRDISEKYAEYENVIYEICNEPNGATTWTNIKNYANQIIPLIRENDPDAIIIVGTPTWSQDVDVAAEDPISDQTNVMYALHFYAGTHGADLRKRAKEALDAGLPLFVSEFGICDASGNGSLDIEEANRWMTFLNENNISCIQWNLSNKNEASALIRSDCNALTGWKESDLSESGAWMLEHIGSVQ